jgi:histidinol dehydrogenase
MTEIDIGLRMELQVERLAQLSAERRAVLLGRGRAQLQERREAVRRILDDVRERGDAALLEYAERFDTRPERLRVPEEEIRAALATADPAYVSALRQAAEHVETFHRAQVMEEPPVETAPGVRLWRVWRPIARIGIYTPGGGALYPSCLLMSAIPARVAGCREVVVCTPPGPDGRVPAAVLAAAALARVTEVYAVGGVQAIAAMAFGTQTIRRVDKIFGPGSSYVAAAKALVASEVAIDLPAGPSEVLIVADETAHPEWIAADLLAQAEHGPESACVLVTASAALAEAVLSAMAWQIAKLVTAPVISESLRNNGALLVADTLDAALDFANAYAAEHLEIVACDADTLVERVQHAGSVFLGSWSAVAAGDYASGGNHTLPTAGYARGFGPLSLEAFGRKMQVQELDERGLRGLRDSIQTLATAEGLPGHAASVRARFIDVRAPGDGTGEATP